jgi:hypothetical protein
MSTLKLKTTKHKVEWCLKNREATREDDTLLVMSVWKNFHRSDFMHFINRSLRALEVPLPHEISGQTGDMGHLPSFESIRRLRQKFNEAGEYLPSDKTMRKRGRKVEQVVDDIRDFERY